MESKTLTKPRRLSEQEGQEVCRQGEAIYWKTIQPTLQQEDKGKYLLINVETGDYEIDEDEIAASQRARKRPGGDTPRYYLKHIGFKAAVLFNNISTKGLAEEW